jgi:hypothetical protein
MMKTKRLGLIAAFSVFAAISLPQSCCAQSNLYETLTVDGVGSLYIDSVQNGVPVDYVYLNYPAIFTLSYTGVYPDIYTVGFVTMSLQFLSIPNPPIFIDLHAIGSSTYQQFDAADFTLVDAGMDGFIASSFMTSDHRIIAEMTNRTGSLDPLNNAVLMGAFQGQVPEPSSFVLATSGLLALLVFAEIRGFFTR